MTLKLIAGPAVEPLTATEAKAHLRVDIATEDTYIGSLIRLAREAVETITRRALITQTWELVLDAFPEGDRLGLPLPPLQSVISISYRRADDVVGTMDAGDYVVDADSEPGRVRLKEGRQWYGGTLYPLSAVRVRYVAGYGDSGESVPQSIRQAMLLLAGHYYENREAVMAGQAVHELPRGVESLLWTYRMVVF